MKESPQENAEHLSKDQNENGGNKLVDQKTSLWKQTYENILVGLGFCVIKLNFSSVILYSAVHRNPYDICRITEIEAGR